MKNLIPKFFFKLTSLSLTSSNSNIALAKQRVALLKLIKKFPAWAEGHLKLAQIESVIYRSQANAVDPRAIARIRVSLQAAKTLLGSERDSGVDFVFGMLCFFEKDFEQAVEALRAYIDSADSRANELLYITALETAGSSALMLGNERYAFEFIKDIPEQKLDRDTRLVKQHLLNKLENPCDEHGQAAKC